MRFKLPQHSLLRKTKQGIHLHRDSHCDGDGDGDRTCGLRLILITG